MKLFYPRSVNSALLISIVSLMFVSCSKKMMFQNSSAVPAAEGAVKYKTDRNNNYEIKVDVNNLAGSDKLIPPRSTYVVWMESEKNGMKNLGQLKSSSGIFSSKLKASLRAVSAFKPRRFFITAEDDASISFPGPQVVLRTN
ncbi:MAG: hypothetical protein Q7T76_00130 [Ferruginibacter sp.]|nr:hypothetical protein [Ferruginibacter sp.]